MNNKVVEVKHAPSTMSRGHQGHGWMMIGCGVMLALVLILVVTGAVGATRLVGAVACIAAMAMMMMLMSRSMGGHDHHGNG